MQRVFKSVPYIKRSFLQRIFNQHPSDNSIISLNNLLANKELLNITVSEVTDIEKHYQMNFISDYNLNIQEFFAVYWNEYLKLNREYLQDKEQVAHLIKILGLSKDTVQMIQEKIGEIWFTQASNIAVSKSRLSKEDRIGLQNLQKRLNIGEKFADHILTKAKEIMVEHFVSKIIKQNRCSPSEETDLNTMLISFEISSARCKSIENKMAPVKSFWQLANNPLRIIVASLINIPNNDDCFFETTNVQWLEMRGMSARTKYLEVINKGSLVLTGKCFFFAGNMKNSKLLLDRIVKYERITNGVKLTKDKGKDIYLKFSGADDENFHIIITRLLNGEVPS